MSRRHRRNLRRVALPRLGPTTMFSPLCTVAVAICLLLHLDKLLRRRDPRFKVFDEPVPLAELVKDLHSKKTTATLSGAHDILLGKFAEKKPEEKKWKVRLVVDGHRVHRIPGRTYEWHW